MSTSKQGGPVSVLVEGGHSPTGTKTETGRKKFWAKHKAEVVLRLLRGEPLDVVSRELGVGAGVLASWRDNFLCAGEAGLAKQPSEKDQLEIQRLNAKIGEITMENELLYSKIAKMEQNRPLALRRRTK